ncbi:hypothetical protein CLV31_11488 [Algoriphagus aquaeductus]|uniref:Uncharacterized protein n=1 Tax=Algoriphagus aquaeductus TaxID=475299 RepID=A0A326RPN5_9BACT|nr:hypothetical protein CLV31_11488 [Algoriphagus aquaeductus]
MAQVFFSPCLPFFLAKHTSNPTNPSCELVFHPDQESVFTYLLNLLKNLFTYFYLFLIFIILLDHQNIFFHLKPIRHDYDYDQSFQN